MRNPARPRLTIPASLAITVVGAMNGCSSNPAPAPDVAPVDVAADTQVVDVMPVDVATDRSDVATDRSIADITTLDVVADASPDALVRDATMTDTCATG